MGTPGYGSMLTFYFKSLTPLALPVILLESIQNPLFLAFDLIDVSGSN
jgi:hypothetical protein